MGRNAKKMIIAILFALGLCVGSAGCQAYLIFGKDLAVWPCITRCRTCGERVWAWQRYDLRGYKVEGVAGMTGYLHDDCDTPTVKVKMEVTPTENGCCVHFNGLELRPKEAIQGSIAVGPKTQLEI